MPLLAKLSRLNGKFRTLSRRRSYSAFRPIRRRFNEGLWSNAAHAVGARFEFLSDEFYRISRGDERVIFYRGQAPLDNPNLFRLAGDKPLLYRLYDECSLPSPKYCVVNFKRSVAGYAFLKSLGKPVVVKPARDSGGGEGVTMNVITPSQLRKAVSLAFAFCDEALIEEQIAGHSFRLLFLDGKLVDAVRRDPPTLKGDGRTALRTLIERENTRRKNCDPISALSPLTIDRDMRMTLDKQNLELGSIAPIGATIKIKSVANENSATDNHRVTGNIHPTTIRLARRFVLRFGFELVGVDIICRSIDEPLDQPNGVFSEVNTGPGLHHHYLTSSGGGDVNVAERIVEYSLLQSAQRTGKNQPC